jgi:hypothetical protein
MLARLIDSAREGYEKHQDFVLLALLFASFRFMTLLLFEPGGFVLDWSGYYIPGGSFVELSDWGYYPVIDYWMEYPPLFPWLSVLAYRLSLFIPLWRDPELWYNLLLGSALLLFEIGSFLLIYAIALKLRGREGAMRSAWLYAGLFFPLMTLLFWFENFALFFLLLGVYMILARRPVWGGVAAGMGFMVKLVPAFIGPVALRVFPRLPQKITYVVVAVCITLLIALPFLLNNATFFLTPFLYQGGTGPWETVWALLDGYYSGGETTPFEMRFDPSDIAVSFHESQFPYGIVATAFVVIYLFLYTRRVDWQDNMKAVAFCGLSISLFLIFSKGYSPQWIINLLPFIVLLLPDLRGVVYSILLMGANVLEFPIAMVLIADHPWVFMIAVLLRTVLLVLVSVELGLILFPSSRAKKALGWALTSVVLLVLLGAIPVAALAARDYSAERYAESAYPETIDYLRRQPRAGVIFTDPLLYRQVYSFLVGNQGLYLVEANEGLPAALSDLMARHQAVYVIYVGSEDDQRSSAEVEGWLSQNAFPVSVEWLGNARLTRYSRPKSALEERPLVANFAGQIELMEYALDPGPTFPGDVLHVRLSWRSVHPTESDYTVFVHLVDEGDRVWSQHDGQPIGGTQPTSSWQVGQEITDNHGLALPADVPPGEYYLAVGLYDPSTGERLLAASDAQVTPRDRVLAGPLLIDQTSRGFQPPGG